MLGVSGQRLCQSSRAKSLAGFGAKRRGRKKRIAVQVDLVELTAFRIDKLRLRQDAWTVVLNTIRNLLDEIPGIRKDRLFLAPAALLATLGGGEQLGSWTPLVPKHGK